MTRAAIALGSNLGDRLAYLRAGVKGIREFVSLKSVSSLYQTAPVGGPAQDPYLNAVAVVETDLEPATLLQRLHEVEADSDRERMEPLGPRTLDLDLILHGTAFVSTEAVEVPHPRAFERRFVLEPLSEVWPSAPLGSTTAREALANLSDQQVTRIMGPGWEIPHSLKPGLWVGGQLVALLGYAALLFLGSQGEFPAVGGILSWVGGAVALLGAVLASYGSGMLRPYLRPAPAPVEGAPLVDHGIFGMARHPIYGGLICLCVGIALIFHSALGLVGAAGVAAFFNAKSRFEEGLLMAAYPGYLAYRRHVPKRFIPFLI